MKKVDYEPFSANLRHQRILYSYEMSIRTATCLESLDIHTIDQLIKWSEAELLNTKNIGRKSITELKNILSGLDLELKADIKPLFIAVMSNTYKKPSRLIIRDDARELVNAVQEAIASENSCECPSMLAEYNRYNRYIYCDTLVEFIAKYIK